MVILGAVRRGAKHAIKGLTQATKNWKKVHKQQRLGMLSPQAFWLPRSLTAQKAIRKQQAIIDNLQRKSAGTTEAEMRKMVQKANKLLMKQKLTAKHDVFARAERIRLKGDIFVKYDTPRMAVLRKEQRLFHQSSDVLSQALKVSCPNRTMQL